jgi:hypothetical protein
LILFASVARAATAASKKKMTPISAKQHSHHL